MDRVQSLREQCQELFCSNDCLQHHVKTHIKMADYSFAVARRRARARLVLYKSALRDMHHLIQSQRVQAKKTLARLIALLDSDAESIPTTEYEKLLFHMNELGGIIPHLEESFMFLSNKNSLVDTGFRKMRKKQVPEFVPSLQQIRKEEREVKILAKRALSTITLSQEAVRDYSGRKRQNFHFRSLGSRKRQMSKQMETKLLQGAAESTSADIQRLHFSESKLTSLVRDLRSRIQLHEEAYTEESKSLLKHVADEHQTESLKECICDIEQQLQDTQEKRESLMVIRSSLLKSIPLKSRGRRQNK